jgi:hypothetical protein
MKEVDLRICSHERQLLAISDIGTRTSGRFLNSAGSSRAMLLAGFIFRFEQCRVSIRRNFAVGGPGRTLSVLRLTTMLLKRSSGGRAWPRSLGTGTGCSYEAESVKRRSTI